MPQPVSRVFWPNPVFLLLVIVAAAGAGARAQSASPKITFGFDFPGSQPDRYLITLTADGRASYESDGKLTADSDNSGSFRSDFNISPAAAARAFDLARKARYFEVELDSKKKGLASTGVKTLTYQDGQRTHQSTYNYSNIAAVEELTQFFQNLSTTMEFGRRLEYFHRYQKLALAEELKRMEEMSKNNGVSELQAVAPILQQIASDPTVMNTVRARAQRLIAQSGHEDK